MDGFTKKQVATVTGLAPRAVQFYTEEGLVVPAVDPGAGRGKFRRYSTANLFQFLLIKQLSDYGMNLSKVKTLFDFFYMNIMSVVEERGLEAHKESVRAITVFYVNWMQQHEPTGATQLIEAYLAKQPDGFKDRWLFYCTDPDGNPRIGKWGAMSGLVGDKLHPLLPPRSEMPWMALLVIDLGALWDKAKTA